MSKIRLGRQPDLFATPTDPFDGPGQVPAWVTHPEEVEGIRAKLLVMLKVVREATEFPYRDVAAAMSAGMRFNGLAEIWLPPEMGHPLQVEYAAEMERLGEAADIPTYDWIGRHRPPPV